MIENNRRFVARRFIRLLAEIGGRLREKKKRKEKKRKKGEKKKRKKGRKEGGKSTQRRMLR